MRVKKGIFVSFILALLFLQGTSQAQDEEYRKLLEEQNALSEKVDAFKAEQDFLLFRKILRSSDSKYLILNMSSRKGELWYKGRVLRDYPLIAITKSGVPLKQGAVALTKKVEGPRKKHALVFGKTIILQAKDAALYREEGIPRIVVPKKDFRALYFALERGALAYIRP